jgi:hypothetical protein
VGGFSGTSWEAATGGRSAGRSRRRPTTVPTPAYTATVVLDRVASTDPEILDAARNRLAERLEWMATTTGYTVVGVTWSSVPTEVFATVRLTATAELAPRMDGEWPAIRAAIAEDLADRQSAERAEPDGETAVSDRLDALAAAASYWSDPEYRKTWTGA